MSGVFGLWYLDGRPVEPETLGRMGEVMAHRGPDGAGVWRDGRVGVGHLAFHTTPESGFAEQPLVNGEGDPVVSADVRLDNRERLLKTLGYDSPPWEVSDAALILRAYQRWGEECVEHLIGDFAFVIWDRSENRLFCARDHFGVRPLYYVHSPGRLFACASEVKALLTLPEVSKEVDDLEVARLLVLPVWDNPGATFYREVRRVQPAHSLTVGTEGTRERRYWSLDPERTLRLGSDEEYAEAVRESFVEAVNARLRAAGRIGTMLSGGLDSSAITCVAAQSLAGSDSQLPLRTFSAVYPTATASDERRYIHEILRMYDTEPHFFSADAVNPLGEAEVLGRIIDGPIEGGNAYSGWNLYRSAADSGTQVVLDGFDGDTTISHGTGRLTELALANHWWALAWELRDFARTTNEPWYPVFRSWVRGYAIKPLVRKLRGFDNGDTSWAKHTAARLRMLEDDYRRRIEPHIEPRPKEPRTAREEHYGRLTRADLLKNLGIVEALGAGAGVEVRFPFFDVRLVELCLSIPAEQKLRRGWIKFVMRNSMNGILPEKVRWRLDKSDLSAGLYYALRTHGRGSMESVANSSERSLAEFIKPSYVAETYPRFLAGTLSKFPEFYYWRVLVLALWLMGREQGSTVDGGSPSINFDRGHTPSKLPR